MAWDISRRIFLRGAGLAALGVGFHPSNLLVRTALAAGLGDRVLVQLFLRGGLDGLNFLVPFGDGDYYNLRPNIALRDGLHNLNGFFGLHPALTGLRDLYSEGVLAFHPAVGNGNLTRSHFDAQDFMDQATPGVRTTHDGWLGRMTPQLPGHPLMETVAFAAQLPRSCFGVEPAFVTSNLTTFDLRAGTGTRIFRTEAESVLREMYATGDDDVTRSGRETFDAIQIIQRSPDLTATPSNGAVYPNVSVGTSLRQAAQIIKAGLGTRCIYIAQGGSFDTHQGEINAHNVEFPNLGNAIRAFRQDLGSKIGDVLLMLTTEFGRTATENGSVGTDHGFAHCELFMGGSVRGGRVHGTWPGLRKDQLNEQRDLAYTLDFRDSFAMAARWLGATDLSKVLPGFTPGPDPGIVA